MPNIMIPDEYADFPLAYAGRSLAPELTTALQALSGAIKKYSILSLRESEAARARIAEINGCRICQKFRTATDLPAYLEKIGEDSSTGIHTHGPAPDENFYRNVANWRGSPLYSEREKIAIEFSERFSETPDALGYEEDFWSRAKVHFSDAELYDLTVTVAGFVAAGRVVHVLGFDQAVCPLDDAAPQVAIAAE